MERSNNNRTNARAWAMKLLFQYSFTHDSIDDIMAAAESFEEFESYSDDSYITDILKKTIDNIESIDEAIASCTNTGGWNKNRIPKLTLTIMRLSVAEMRYRDDIPMSVSINEAIELAKKYDYEKAPPFVNGVLSAVAKKEDLK